MKDLVMRRSVSHKRVRKCRVIFERTDRRIQKWNEVNL